MTVSGDVSTVNCDISPRFQLSEPSGHQKSGRPEGRLLCGGLLLLLLRGARPRLRVPADQLTAEAAEEPEVPLSQEPESGGLSVFILLRWRQALPPRARAIAMN